MINCKELLFFSILSYCNFGEKEYNKTLEEIYNYPDSEYILASNFKVLDFKNKDYTFNFFEEIFSSWKIFYVDNRTSLSDKKNKSGFYSVVFTNDEYYVITYRGSEILPLEDAYKDFIKTDLKIGLGKIPLQFFEGFEVFQKLLNMGIDKEKIILNGHSLGGGIAQFVALESDKNHSFIPITYTWNGIGINRRGIVTLVDFINLESFFIEKNLEISSNLKAFLSIYQKEFKNYLIKKLKKEKIFKNDVEYFAENILNINFEINNIIIEEIKNETNFYPLKKLYLTDEYSDFFNKTFWENLLNTDYLLKNIFYAEKYIKKVENNKEYENKIFNYGHSKDFTFSIFGHLGKKLPIDLKLTPVTEGKTDFFRNFNFFNISINSLHREDVFLPYLHINGINKGNFSLTLNTDFIASSIRKLITEEKYIEKELLISYYSLDKINEQNFQIIKNSLITSLKQTKLELLYLEQIIDYILDITEDELFILWEKLKTKLVSPYKKIDIFDIFYF